MLGHRETLEFAAQIDFLVLYTKTGTTFWTTAEKGDQGSQTYLEGLVYGREMANTLAYCSAAKFL